MLLRRVNFVVRLTDVVVALYMVVSVVHAINPIILQFVTKKVKPKHVREVECVDSPDDSSDSEYFIGSNSIEKSDNEALVIDVKNDNTDNDDKGSDVPPESYEIGSKHDDGDKKPVRYPLKTLMPVIEFLRILIIMKSVRCFL